MDNKIYLEISWQSLYRVLAFVVLVGLIYLTRGIILITLFAIIIAAICQPLIDFFQKKKIPRWLGSSLVFILILAILGIFFWFVIPLTVSQFRNFSISLEGIILKIGNYDFLRRPVYLLVANFREAFEGFVSNTGSLSSFIFSFFGGVFSVFTCLILAFYFSLTENGIENFFRMILPKIYEDRIITIFKNSKRRINRWFQGRMLISLIIGLASWIGLFLFGVKYSGTLALLAAVLDIIPLIGPIIAALIAFLVASADSLLLGIWAVAFFIVVQSGVDLFGPLIIGKAVGLPLLAVLFALLIGSKIAGLFGFLLAIPVTIILQEIFRESFEKKLK